MYNKIYFIGKSVYVDFIFIILRRNISVLNQEVMRNKVSKKIWFT